MKVLLTTLNARYSHSSLALQYLKDAALAGSAQNEILVKEFTINQGLDWILREICRLNPDMACFSLYIWNISQSLSIIRNLKAVRPKTVVVAGGPEASYETAALMGEHGIDAIARGEGEAAFPKLLGVYGSLLEGSASESSLFPLLEAIPGISFKLGQNVFENKDASPIDMRVLPFPYRNGLDEFKDRIIYYETSRGCPFSCSYCLSGNDPLRALPLGRVFDELSFFLEQKPKQVKLVDRTFNCLKDRALAIWEFLISHDNGATNFHFEIGGDLLGSDELSSLKRARKGLFQFEVGVQSSNERTLEAISRKSDLRKLCENVKALRSLSNIHLHLDLIAGLPGEGIGDIIESFNKVSSLERKLC
jgi:radical SAM superfamily enzyme YgiQ (UPF0313 family)